MQARFGMNKASITRIIAIIAAMNGPIAAPPRVTPIIAKKTPMTM